MNGMGYRIPGRDRRGVQVLEHFSVLHEAIIRCATKGITSEDEFGVLAFKLSSAIIDCPFS
jgi:hypothetical protein